MQSGRQKGIWTPSSWGEALLQQSPERPGCEVSQDLDSRTWGCTRLRKTWGKITAQKDIKESCMWPLLVSAAIAYEQPHNLLAKVNQDSATITAIEKWSLFIHLLCCWGIGVGSLFGGFLLCPYSHGQECQTAGSSAFIAAIEVLYHVKFLILREIRTYDHIPTAWARHQSVTRWSYSIKTYCTFTIALNSPKTS